MELNTQSKEGSNVVLQPLVQSPYRPTTTTPRSRTNLMLACTTANLASFAAGHCFTWTSPTLPLLQKENDILLIDQDQSAWIASLIALGAVFGPLIAGALVNQIGRRLTLVLAVLNLIASWALLLLTAEAHSIKLMYLARFTAGVGGGIVYTVVPIYVAEISEDDIRSALGSMMSFFLCSGFLVPYLLGPYVSYIVLIVACLASPITFLVVSIFLVPETPLYLLQKGRDKVALKNLTWLRSGVDSEEVKKELQAMKLSVEEAQQNSGNIKDLFSTVANRRALLISCGLVGGQQLSGINVVLFYAEGIFRMTGSDLSPSICSIIIATILILSSGIAAPLTRAHGMKKLLVLSAVGMGTFQLLLAGYFGLNETNRELARDLSFIPILSLVGYIITYAVGFGPLPWAVMAEMFPANVKAVGSALTASFCWTIGFLMTKFFVTLCESLGELISFGIFGLFCFAMIYFTIYLVPDTQGMSFEEIQEVLNGRSMLMNKV